MNMKFKQLKIKGEKMIDLKELSTENLANDLKQLASIEALDDIKSILAKYKITKFDVGQIQQLINILSIDLCNRILEKNQKKKNMEIKFRAWDKKNKIMTYSEVNSINFNGQILLNDGKFHDIKDTDYVLMQYTGLKDVNGKEIFENDILSHKYCSPKNSDELLLARFATLKETDKSFKVIGNIYENPELLTTKK